MKYSPKKHIYDFGRGASDKTDQDNKKVINSNIITGFNKTSRILTTPYSQFYHRFYQDCIIAENIYIVGYSFGDIHINKAIKTASLINKKLKIYCVTYVSIDEYGGVPNTDWIKLNDRSFKFFQKNHTCPYFLENTNSLVFK